MSSSTSPLSPLRPETTPKPRQRSLPSTADGYVLVREMPTRNSRVQTASPETTPGDPVQISQRLTATAQSLSAHLRRLATPREQVLLLRDQVAYQREEYHRLRDYVLEVMQEAALSLTKLPDDVSLPQFLDHLKWHCGKLEQDQARLREQMSKVDALEIALSNLEYEMQQQESRLAEFSDATIKGIEQAVLRIPGAPGIAAALADIQEPPVTHYQEPPPADPLLEDFYNKLGDAKIIQERLVDFDIDFGEARTRRIFDEEQERPVEGSFEDFEQPWIRERNSLQSALTQSIATADAAREACITAGLNPDGYKDHLPDQPSSGAIGPEGEEGMQEVEAISLEVANSPSALRVAFPRPEYPGQRDPDPFARLELDEPPQERGVEQSHERIETWMQDLPEREQPSAPSSWPESDQNKLLNSQNQPPRKVGARRSWPESSNALPSTTLETVEVVTFDRTRRTAKEATHSPQRPELVERRSSESNLPKLPRSVRKPREERIKK